MVWLNKLSVNQQIFTVQVIPVELRAISCHLLSQEHLTCTQVDLAPVVVQQVAVVKMSHEPRQNVSHLAMYILDEDEFTDDPHQIKPIEDAFVLPYIPRQGFEGFDHGYVLPAEIQGTYYQVSGDIKPGYTSAYPWGHPLDHQGNVALKLHFGVTANSSYIGLVLTRIVYPQQEDPNIRINQYNYFDIIASVPPPNHHSIWGCLHDLT